MTAHTDHAAVEVTDWWCPTDERWVWCPGPCPDGREHNQTRTRTVQARTLHGKRPLNG